MKPRSDYVETSAGLRFRSEIRRRGWTLPGITFRELIRRVWRGALDDELPDRAAGLAFYLLFALFPALLFLTALAGLISEPRLIEELLGYAAHTMPAQAAWLLRETFGEIIGGARKGFLSLGILIAFGSASNGMVSVIAVLNKIFDAAESRSWWKRFLISLGLTLAFSILILVSLLLLGLGSSMGEKLALYAGVDAHFRPVWKAVSWILGLWAALGGVSLVYAIAPADERPVRGFSPGACFAVASWLAMSVGLRLSLVLSGGTNAVYGSIAGIVVLLLWLYLGALALLIGAELDAQLDRAAAL